MDEITGSPDWEAIRNEYIQTTISQRDLAAKHGVSYRTLSKRSTAEGWVDLRCQVCEARVAKTRDLIADQQVEVDTQIRDAAIQLLTAFRTSVGAAAKSIIPPSVLKDYASALQSIQKTLRFGPTELDMKEQMARINKLNRDAAAGDEDDDETGVVFLPPTLEVDEDA